MPAFRSRGIAAKSNQLEEPEEVEELDEELESDDDDDEDADVTALTEDDTEEASLDELLAQRAAARRGTDESEEEDIMSLASERQLPAIGPLPTKVIPVKDRQEFVCERCHLVKARSQLADPERGLCRDCV